MQLNDELFALSEIVLHGSPSCSGLSVPLIFMFFNFSHRKPSLMRSTLNEQQFKEIRVKPKTTEFQFWPNFELYISNHSLRTGIESPKPNNHSPPSNPRCGPSIHLPSSPRSSALSYILSTHRRLRLVKDQVMHPYERTGSRLLWSIFSFVSLNISLNVRSQWME